MKILLLEDKAPKAALITDVIKNVFNQDPDITTDLNTAKQKLKEIKYDIFIVDIQVPDRFNETPQKDGGYKLIYKLYKRTRGYNLPSHIIAITEFDESYKEYKKQFKNELISFLKYNEVSDSWSNHLEQKLKYIQESHKFNNMSIDYQYDLAIICALKEPELKYIKELSHDWTNINLPNSSLPFEECIFNFESKKLKVVIISINKMGMVATSVLATQMIEYFRPRYLAMTGIAAGVKGEVELGDILVATPIWDSGAGKLKRDKEGKGIFEIDPKQETIDSDIENDLGTLSDDTSFLNKVRENWKAEKIKTVLNVHIGPLVSGAAVIADSEITDKIIKLQSRKLIGIEMEAYGLIYAAKHATKPKPEPIIIKSVCDFADENKKDGYQSYAAYTSAQFLYEFAKRYID